MKRVLLEEIQVGTRTILNTDWPVYDQLHREGERTWVVTRELCNGAPRSSETYRSERAAREAFAGRAEGRKPRAASAGRPLTLRVSDEERERWTTAADKEELTISDWLRAAAELAIVRSATK